MSWLARIRNVFRPRQLWGDIDAEMQFHLSERTDDLTAKGMRPDLARREAERRFGNLAVQKESTRDMNLVLRIETLFADLRYALRGIRRAPGFAAIAILSLGIGIGATTTMFSAINGVLLTPLPYPDPDRLVVLREASIQQTVGRAGVSVPNFIDWKNETRSFEALAAYRPWGYVLTGSGDPERLSGARVTANLFALLGVTPLIGRAFVEGEDAIGNHRVALIGETLWRDRFGADSGTLGRPILLDGESYSVVGVIPATFTLPEAQVWVPFAFQQWELMQRGARALSVVGRLRSGVDARAAGAELSAVSARLATRYPEANTGWGSVVTPLRTEVEGSSRVPLLLLFAAVGAVLAIACAHLTILLLGRSVARSREIAVRMALGAGHHRIVQQLAIENGFIALAACALGLIAASAGTRVLTSLGPSFLPRGADIRVDAVVVGFAILASLVAGLLLACTAAIAVTRLDLSQSMKQTSTWRSARRRRFEFRDVAVVGQFALTLALLAIAGLLVRSFLNLRSVELGFTPRRVLVASVSLGGKYQRPEQRIAFFDELLSSLTVEPEVRSAGIVSHLPLAPGPLTADVTTEGRASSSGLLPTVRMNNVTSGYFAAMNIPVREGRTFAETDRMGSPPVVMVDDAVARSLWGSESPVGRRIRLGASIGADPSWREVIGVVSSVRAERIEGDPSPTIYVPYPQNPWPTMSLVVATTGDPGRLADAVRRSVLALDPTQPVYALRSMDDILARVLAPRRFQMFLLGGFALAALLLALLGVYAVFAHAVAQRARELGIRIALGGGYAGVISLILRRAALLMGIGLVLGVAGAAIVGRSLAALLFGVGPYDGVTLTGAAMLLAMAGLLASYIPARRAAKVDPLVALRGD